MESRDLDILKAVREKNSVISKTRKDVRKELLDEYMISGETRDVLEGKETGIPIVTKSGKVSAMCGLALTKNMKDPKSKKIVIDAVRSIDISLKELKRISDEEKEILESLDPQTKAMLKYFEEQEDKE